ncbi:MAG: hypothetical protein AB8B95_00140 [Pseudohongiellaceae bacterium]
MSSSTDYPQLIHQFIADEQLPAEFEEDAIRWFLPLKDRLLNSVRSHPGNPRVIGINGAQGTGKSTLAKLLQILLSSDGLNVANLSIDDFYFSVHKRQELADSVHPLLRTRGVPGTHDASLAINTLDTLKALSSIETFALPHFDKAQDEPAPHDEWVSIQGPVDLIILEGWFVGAAVMESESLCEPVNSLETDEDRDLTWRQFVNQSLETDYQPLFSRLDELILLQAPNFEQVYLWRSEQERKLRDRRGDAAGIMGEQELERFIQHFERLTRHCLATLPNRASVVFELDSSHRISTSTLSH